MTARLPHVACAARLARLISVEDFGAQMLAASVF